MKHQSKWDGLLLNISASAVAAPSKAAEPSLPLTEAARQRDAAARAALALGKTMATPKDLQELHEWQCRTRGRRRRL